MMKGVALLSVFITLVVYCAAKEDYSGHQVWRVHVADDVNKQVVDSVFGRYAVDIWSVGVDYIDIRINGKIKFITATALKYLNVKFEVLIDDIGRLINAELNQKSATNKAFDFGIYHNYTEIEEYIEDLSQNNSMVSTSSIGQTLEGRTLWEVVISTGAPEKPSIWIDCGIHAREWITPATCLYGLDLLSNGYNGADPQITQLLDTYDIHMVPVVNPDGYDFSWTDDRMWRKNRRVHADEICIGVDLNRNFDVEWGTSSSGIACAQDHHGDSPASELEVQAIQQRLDSLVSSPEGMNQLYSIHSYSQFWLYSYGYTVQDTPNANELARVSGVGAEALKAVYGTQYTNGTFFNVLYAASGTTQDYAYSIGVNFSFTVELRDTGEFGFLLPADQILPTAEETWAGLMAAILSV